LKRSPGGGTILDKNLGTNCTKDKIVVVKTIFLV